MAGLLTFSALAACVDPPALWAIECVERSAAANTGSTSGITYRQPSKGQFKAAIPRGGGLQMERSGFSLLQSTPAASVSPGSLQGVVAESVSASR